MFLIYGMGHVRKIDLFLQWVAHTEEVCFQYHFSYLLCQFKGPMGVVPLALAPDLQIIWLPISTGSQSRELQEQETISFSAMAGLGFHLTLRRCIFQNTQGSQFYLIKHSSQAQHFPTFQNSKDALALLKQSTDCISNTAAAASFSESQNVAKKTPIFKPSGTQNLIFLSFLHTLVYLY